MAIEQAQTQNKIIRLDKLGKNWIPDVMVYHIADGTYFGTIGWEQNPISQVSSHFVIGKEGEITQLVPLNMAAYTQGLNYDNTGKAPMVRQAKSLLVRQRGVNPNCYCISIEFAGFYNPHKNSAGIVDDPGCKGAITQAQIDAAIEVEHYCNDQLVKLYGAGAGIPPDRAHHLGHCEINPINRPCCPGELFPYDEILAGITGNPLQPPKGSYVVDCGAIKAQGYTDILISL